MSQKNQVKRALEAGAKISQLTALREFGCMRLADVIHKLRNDGMSIRREWRTQKGKRFAVYKLETCAERGELHDPTTGSDGYPKCRACGLRLEKGAA